MHSTAFLILVLTIIVSVIAQDFSATFQITKKPGLSGTLNGKIYYSEASDKIRWQYNSGYQETISYNKADVNTYFTFKLCGSKCDTTSNPTDLFQPRFYKTSNDINPGQSVTIPGFGTCTRHTRSVNTDEKISQICVNANNQAVEVVYSDGTTYRFKDHTTVTSAQLNAYTSWNCIFSCDSNVDIALVLDVSGSISGVYNPNTSPRYTGEWANVASFAQQFTAKFKIGENKVNMGLVKFANGVWKTTSQLTSSSSTFTSLVNELARCSGSGCDGATNIGKGVVYGVDLLKDQTGIRYLRRNLPKILVVVTDGQDNPKGGDFSLTTNIAGSKTFFNSPDSSNGWGYWAKTTMNVTIVSVAVGGDTDPAFLVKTASAANLYFEAATFNYFSGTEFIQKLGTTVCTTSGSQGGCTVCGGLCACGVCQCPDQCDDGNACTSESCSPSSNGGGCLYKDTSNTCNDGNRCTHDSCNPSTGCTTTPYVVDTDCNDNNRCTIEKCNSATGCFSTPVNCTNPNPCFVGATCNPNNGSCTWYKENLCNDDNPCTFNDCTVPPCQFRPIDCTGGNKCISPTCNRSSTNPYNGCSNATVSCDDGNACTVDTCDPVAGCIHTLNNCNDNDLCTDDSCDDKIGCINQRFNVSERCNKGDLCTNYTCSATVGCTEAPLQCTNNYNDSCIWVLCDPLQGCAPVPKKCNYTGTESASCYVNYCDSSKDDTSNCYYEQTDECKLTIIASTTGAILGVGAIVGIIIAAVVCVGGTTTLAVLGFNGAFSGEFENKNPLFEAETKVGKNELYKRNSKAPKPN